MKKVCNVLFFVVVLPNFFFGIWEVFNVKEMDDIWFYEPLLSSGNIFASFNHFRDGVIRCNGFFVGTLSYAVTGFCSFIIFFIMRKERYSSVKILVSLLMLLMSQTRTFFIGLIFFFILYLFYSIYKKKIDVFLTVVLLLASFLLVLLLLPYFSSDGSALGRIEQWTNALNLLISHPFGQGFFSIGITGDNRADSYIIDLIRIYGVYFIVLLYLTISFIIMTLNSSNHIKYSEIPCLLAISFLFILFFQSLLNTPVFYFIIMILVKVRKENHEKNSYTMCSVQ
ncbi:O-antigen ligase family protein [Photobacterium aphoticum]|nr:O-antigen ligase family protein [Photobacterium aphoticum]